MNRQWCESLETRRLMAFSASQSGTSLNVQSGSSQDALEVVETNGAVQVRDASGAEMNFTGINNIQIWGNNGNDTILYRGTTVGASIHGNAGADYITVVDAGTASSTVNGDADNDVLALVVANTTGGRTTLDGGSGNDTIYINTGYNVDPAEYNFAAAQAMVICSSGTDTVATYAGNSTINGGSGDDTVLVYSGTGVNTYINVEHIVPS
jgi:Ca2+-binding RTX toxin-like protein